ncbi:hypothetical protein IFM89_017885 [Coptis chinensis]|uniref:GrpE protein homolog n=1 Tax=Coptis chinensis TaxID=261450 RepID=A0A835M3S7_9MAGN|nr:hypothetical protein IFM89_017885 [Coptis chinensis]
MFASKVLSRISRTTGLKHCRRNITTCLFRPREECFTTSNHFHSLREPNNKWIPCQVTSLHPSVLSINDFQRFWYSSSPQPTDKEASQSGDGQETVASSSTSANSEGADSKGNSETVGKKEVETSESDVEDDLSYDDLVKLVADKEELLNLKHEEIKRMEDKYLRSYAELKNIMDRTKRDAENSKKFAIQNFAKSLLDVSDNLGRASSVVKESFSKIDTSTDTAGAVPLLKTLLEGVEMTEKQLAMVFKKFGLEKYEPLNEQFDPNKHHALFQIPDASKPPGTIGAVLKAGYTLHDRIIRPAEVGVTEALNNKTEESS